jgi:hypothetical protein
LPSSISHEVVELPRVALAPDDGPAPLPAALLIRVRFAFTYVFERKR